MPDSAPNNRPLAGLRVIDIATYIAAPYCATIMAEFGAEVIKVEQPKVGDPCRRLGTVSECGDTLVWLSEARNKKSVTLNLKSPKGAAILQQLVAPAAAAPYPHTGFVDPIRITVPPQYHEPPAPIS